MSKKKVQLRIEQLGKALNRLEEISNKKATVENGLIDATIQRFEFTFELFWKTLKAILEEKGVNATYPKDVLQESYQGGLIDNERLWLELLKNRNLTSHTYNEDLALQVYKDICKNVPDIRTAYNKLLSWQWKI